VPAIRHGKGFRSHDGSTVLSTNYILIDYENVQPTDLALLDDRPFKVKLFLGANQSKIPVALAVAVQSLGANAEYVHLDSSGPNALDFHIAYYLGALAAQEPSACFDIISKDTGFDPLIRHLKTKGVNVQRRDSIACIPLRNPPPARPPSPSQSPINEVVARLSKMVTNKPRTKKALMSTLGVWFKGDSEPQRTSLFASLRKQGIVALDGDKVSYELPSVPNSNKKR
jgi:hypothetical protein